MTNDRRDFLKRAGIAVLTVQCLPLFAEASTSPRTEGVNTGENLIIESGPGLFRHVHDLLIPYAVLDAPPPQGITLTSTQSMLHQHNITLTRNELATVKQGGTVTQKASSHEFVIALARQRKRPEE